jgi:hypothetical protein
MRTSTGLGVSGVTHPPQGLSVKIKQENWDHPHPPNQDNRTSVRFFTDDARALKPSRDPKDPRQYYQPRDRDLGQTFTTPPDSSFRLTAITLRTGPAAKAVGPDAPRAHVSLQLFAVDGTPKVHHDTVLPHDPKYDYFIGETYESLWVVSGGVLPADLQKDQWLRWEFPDDSPVLQPERRYAFLVMFDEPARGRELALANLYNGPRAFGGHGIRREGRAPNPSSPVGDLSWVNKPKAGSFLDWEVRLGQQPGTWGRPDVDTTRVLTLFIEGT